MPQSAMVMAVFYVIGVMWGLLVSDARPAERVALAVLWPIGPLALIVTLATLLGAAAIALLPTRSGPRRSASAGNPAR